jgi:hypothetical protein
VISTKGKAVFIGGPEFVTGIILWAIVGTVIYTTAGMAVMEADLTPGPRFLPLVVAVILSLLTILYWREAWKNREQGIQFPGINQLARPAAFFGIALLIVLLWDFLGAMPVVLLVSFLEIKFLEKHSWQHSLLVAVILCAFIYGIFEGVLGISLPQGIF